MKIEVKDGNNWVKVRTQTIKDDYEFGVAIRALSSAGKLTDGFDGDALVGMLLCLSHTYEASFSLPALTSIDELMQTFGMWKSSEGVFSFPFVKSWREAVTKVDMPANPIIMTPIADPNA